MGWSIYKVQRRHLLASVNNAFQSSGVYLWYPSGLTSNYEKQSDKGTGDFSGNRPVSIPALLLINPVLS